MAAVPGQPAPKPQSLARPVPGSAEQDEVDALFADMKPAKMAAPAGAAPTDEVDALFADMEAPAPAPDAAPTEGDFAAEPGFMQANMEQLNPQNLVTRIQAGLAANNTEKKGFLERKFGSGNVAEKNGKLYYRREKGEKLKPLDPDTFELISDIIPDFAREIVSEAAMIPGEVAGAVGGAVAGFGLGAPVTAPGGALAGRVASVPLANRAANKAAELAGVPQDPSRSGLAEDAIGMGLEAVMPVVGSKIAGAVARRIPGTATYKAAKEAGKKEVVALTEQMQDVLKNADMLEQSGYIKALPGEAIGVPGANVNLMLHQVAPESPTVKGLLKQVADAPRLINAETQQAEAYGASLNNMLTEIARRGGHGPVAPEKLGSTITDAVRTLEKAEGQAIAKFRNEAMKNLKNEKVPLPQNSAEQLKALTRELGFTFRALPDGKGLSITPPKDLRAQVGKLGTTSIGETRALVNNINDVAQLANKGGLRLSDIERLRNTIGEAGRSLRGTRAGAELSRMSGDLRQQYRETIGRGLKDDIDRTAFNSAMDDFGTIKAGADQLSDILRGDVSAKTIVNGFFKGKENLANIRALKSITGDDSPQWGALKEEFINQLILKHSADSATGFNSKAFLKEVEKNYGDDFMREVLNDGKNGPNYDTLKKMLSVGQVIEKSARSIKPDNDRINQGIMDTVIGLASGIKFKTINGLSAIIGANKGQEHALMELLSRDGVEKYVSGYPKKLTAEQKRSVTQNLKDMLGQYKMMRNVQKSADAAKEIGAAATPTLKRGAKATIREDLMRGDE